MIVYSLGLFGLLWTSSDFFGHLVIFFGPFFDFLDVSPGSLGDPAIVTRFWPKNRPFLTPPPSTWGKGGRGQIGPNSCFPIDIVLIWGVQEFPRWFQGPWVALPLWPDFDLKIGHFWPPRAHGRRMAGVKVALIHVFLLIVFIWGVQEFPHWFQGPWVTLPLWPDFDLKISHFLPPLHTGEGWQGWKRHLTMFSYWYKCDLRH